MPGEIERKAVEEGVKKLLLGASMLLDKATESNHWSYTREYHLGALVVALRVVNNIIYAEWPKEWEEHYKKIVEASNEPEGWVRERVIGGVMKEV